MEISRELKHQIFKTIEGILTLEEFELWLYDQETLISQMDNTFIFALYSFSYKKSGAKIDFEKEMFSFLDKEEFILWKVKSNLITFITTERNSYWDVILNDLNELAFYGLDELYSISQYADCLDMVEYGFFTIEQIEAKIKLDARDMLLWIEMEEAQVSDFKISNWPYFQENESKIKGFLIGEIESTKEIIREIDQGNRNESQDKTVTIFWYCFLFGVMGLLFFKWVF